jgi:hypothetical protein
MQQASSSEIQSAFQKARQAFSEIQYPATKQQLIDKAEEYNAHIEVMQAIESLPDRRYNSTADVLKEFEGFQKLVQAFHELKFPATKQQLVEEAKKVNARSEVVRALENCPDRQYNRPGDVIQECKGKISWGSQ